MRLFQLLLLTLLLMPCHNPAAADDRLPPARTLIQDALAICNDPDQSYVLTRGDLARAYVYLGDIAAAHKVLGAYKDDTWIQSSYEQCAQLEIELTGRFSEVPAALWRDNANDMHWSLACAYARHGDAALALEHARKLPIQPITMLQMYNRRLVNPLIDGGHREAAREILIRWADCFAGTRSISEYRFPDVSVEHDLKRLVDLGERARAKALCEHWQVTVANTTNLNDYTHSIGRSWAALGASWAAIGEREKSIAAMDKAVSWLEMAIAARFDPEFHTLEYAAAFASVAARQALVLATEAAQPTYERAYELAGRPVITSKYQDYGYVQIVKEQLEAGDYSGIPNTLKRMTVPRNRADAWREVSQHYLERGDRPGALTVARAAGAELDRDDLETSIARETANIAECLAKAGDEEFAKRLFRRALALSERHEDPKFDHQWIAGQQVGAGFLVDAYATIKAIPEPETRLIPLAELALAAARLEATAKRP